MPTLKLNKKQNYLCKKKPYQQEDVSDPVAASKITSGAIQKGVPLQDLMSFSLVAWENKQT